MALAPPPNVLLVGNELCAPKGLAGAVEDAPKAKPVFVPGPNPLEDVPPKPPLGPKALEPPLAALGPVVLKGDGVGVAPAAPKPEPDCVPNPPPNGVVADVGALPNPPLLLGAPNEKPTLEVELNEGAGADVLPPRIGLVSIPSSSRVLVNGVVGPAGKTRLVPLDDGVGLEGALSENVGPELVAVVGVGAGVVEVGVCPKLNEGACLVVGVVASPFPNEKLDVAPPAPKVNGLAGEGVDEFFESVPAPNVNEKPLLLPPAGVVGVCALGVASKENVGWDFCGVTVLVWAPKMKVGG